MGHHTLADQWNKGGHFVPIEKKKLQRKTTQEEWQLYVQKQMNNAKMKRKTWPDCKRTNPTASFGKEERKEDPARGRSFLKIAEMARRPEGCRSWGCGRWNDRNRRQSHRAVQSQTSEGQRTCKEMEHNTSIRATQIDNKEHLNVFAMALVQNWPKPCHRGLFCLLQWSITCGKSCHINKLNFDFQD